MTDSRVSIRSKTRRAALAAILCGVAVTAAMSPSNPVEARPVAADVHAQSAPCGVRVYMTASGASGADATNDTAVKTSLENGTNLCVTIGVQYHALSTVSGSVTAANYDVLYLQGQNNWGSGDINAFIASDMAVIDAFVTAGGGVVIGEWLAWDACSKSYAGAWADLATLMPATIRSGCQYGSNQKVRFYSWDRPTAPLVDTGVSSDFIFQPADFAGSLSFMDLKNGATGYYWAAWAWRAGFPQASPAACSPSAPRTVRRN